MKSRGFTLIELIIIVAIIGIIASIILRAYTNTAGTDNFYDELKVLAGICIGVGVIHFATYKLYGDEGLEKMESYSWKIRLGLLGCALFYLLIISF